MRQAKATQHTGRTLIGALLRIAAVMVATARPSRAEPAGVTLEYDVRYGPLPVMSVHTTTQLDGDHYRATTDMHTVGALRFLFPWSTSSVTSGLRTAGQLRPQRYRTVGEYRGDQRLAEIEYAADGGLQARAEPPAERDDRDPVTTALQEHTIDPLTATLTALTSRCRGSLRIFDGRRRYDLTLTDLGDVASLPSSRPIYTGPSRHCRGTIAPLAGFWRTSARRGEQPSQVDYWVAAPRPDLMAVPVYLELAAPAGTLSISLTGAEPLSTADRR